MSKKADIRVIKEPTFVKYTCPYCGFVIDIDYDEFESYMIKEAPYWQGEEFICDECGEDIEVADIEWI